MADDLKEKLQVGGEAELLRRAKDVVGNESRWAEPFALLAGLVDAPDALILALLAANPTLALRAVATAQGLKESTLHKVLELSKDWQERAKVYGQIPEKVGDPKRALALLDRLRRGTTDGGDLYFLDRAYDATARQWPEQAEQVETYRSRLTDHLPAPDVSLFSQIETPLDGRMPLWCKVSAGTYQVGSPDGVGDPDEHPQHEVHLKEDFWIASVPMTNAHYAAFDPGLKPYPWKGVEAGELAFHPRVEITWFAAQAFCIWLSRLYPGARLPTEEEWEIACRAGSEKEYWSGDGEDHLKEVGWYDAKSGSRTHRVGQKKANPFGLYDVHGNVWEWTLSRFSGSSYAGREGGYPLDSQEVSPEPEADPASGVLRVVRGGSYWSTAGRARSAYRGNRLPGGDWQSCGFRVLLPYSPRAMDGRS